MADDDVQLTDLEVIQRYSLAVRGASASRADLVAVLQADLEWLRGGRRGATATGTPDKAAKAAPEKAAKAPAKAASETGATPAKAAAKRSTPAKRPAKG